MQQKKHSSSAQYYIVFIFTFRLKREEDRIAREMAEKEEEEVRAYLESAVKAGKIKAKPVAGKLDKKAVLEEARRSVPLQKSTYDQE